MHSRAALLAKIRKFFSKRAVLEVDCPALSMSAPVDQNIDVMKVSLESAATAYLHTSPEYRMKRLLSYGIGDIYQLSHVFRDNEFGRWHNPEFTMLEWYRVHWSLEQIIMETLDLLQTTLGIIPIKTLTYQEAFKKASKLNCDTCSIQDLTACLKLRKIQVSDTWDRDFLIQVVMNSIIEPSFDSHCLTVITDFPVEQAALAKIRLVNQKHVACRFEVYYKTVELANGYQELTDPKENALRIKQANQARISIGKEALPIDDKFIQDLQKIPPCSGVALGFDRLLAIKYGLNTLQPILPFSWDEV